MEQQGNQESQQTEHSGFVDNNEQYIIPVCLLYLLEYTGILAFSTTGGAQLVDNLILLSNKGTHFLLDIFIHISMCEQNKKNPLNSETQTSRNSKQIHSFSTHLTWIAHSHTR